MQYTQQNRVALHVQLPNVAKTCNKKYCGGRTHGAAPQCLFCVQSDTGDCRAQHPKPAIQPLGPTRPHRRVAASAGLIALGSPDFGVQPIMVRKWHLTCRLHLLSPSSPSANTLRAEAGSHLPADLVRSLLIFQILVHCLFT